MRLKGTGLKNTSGTEWFHLEPAKYAIIARYFVGTSFSQVYPFIISRVFRKADGTLIAFF